MNKSSIIPAILLIIGCVSNELMNLTITSPAFKEGLAIPEKYSCNGAGLMPELNITNLPNGTKALALIIDDPDAPSGTFTHLIAWNIKPENKINISTGIIGVNSAGENSYFPPCPPSGTHRYIFKVYALNATLNLSKSSGKNQLETAMNTHVLAQGKLTGIYSKK